ncbi:gamma-butyrobetaine hydroxylase-like domain-containing protein [Kushneria aurantia]|uniref:Gamma-butyrobetaine hydroxylase-like domain-containing protein n=1 Tax=Kushneria aurantia TaxID=504092 RepID=A0ABV6G537_9GAMM|nr:DUF971 domain-containing protein [Kushneria aurantia]
MTTPPLTNAHYHQKSRELALTWQIDGEQQTFRLSAEMLRVYSPSAEVRGHSPEQAVLQTGMKYVGLKNITPVGNYALKLHFDDGHDSGLYTYAYLWEMIENRELWWEDYLHELDRAGASREPLGIPLQSGS